MVPDGTHKMAVDVASQQSVQSWSLEPAENVFFRTFFPRLHWLFRAKFFRCYASGCMMWRWADRDAKTGFCGLAGNPLQNLFSD